MTYLQGQMADHLISFSLVYIIGKGGKVVSRKNEQGTSANFFIGLTRY